MRSTPESTARFPQREDSILAAALELFGQHGVDGVSVRAIAARAGVSPGLVIHHFGSKEELREACNAHVSKQLVQTKDGAPTSVGIRGTLDTWMQDPSRYDTLLNYLTRMLMDGGDPGLQLFKNLVRDTVTIVQTQMDAGVMRQLDDPEMVAIVLTSQGLASLMLRGHVSEMLGSDSFSPANMQRMMLTMADIYTDGLYANSTLLSATRDAFAAERPES
ncbi:TetR/AcrR family transcriptional regulator [Leucobacter insecticola]|uniref:TetR/AcrR family transcriptional regulator n=1 Tax=Leucobacter insecticola TaxID=2714934 RepID=A0A6G8FL04_9MICO|nr:TetR/AcrR family transcriptional regulator [Leucobacter insecticola]QIM17034.1 TetR/AcrR family transcriptional regulator [Leucobacter insecticola]